MKKDYELITDLNLPWDKLYQKTLLITGANGLIASSLIDAIMECNTVHNLCLNVYALCRNEGNAKKRFEQYKQADNFHLIIQDVSIPLTCKIQFDYIIHAASGAHPDAFNTTPVDVMKANFMGTLNLLEYSLNYKSTRFLFVSSSEVYGENFEHTKVFSETTLGSVDYTKFRSCYPESKRASETLCMSFKKQYNSDIIIVRPAFIYGKDITSSNTRADVYFLRQVLNHQNIIMYSKGTQIRSYCYIDDCISGMLYALLMGESGSIYNIGNEDCVVTLKEYAQTLADIGGVQLIYSPESKPENKVFLQTTQCILDTTSLRKLGWCPKYSLKEGIQDILKYSC